MSLVFLGISHSHRAQTHPDLGNNQLRLACSALQLQEIFAEAKKTGLRVTRDDEMLYLCILYIDIGQDIHIICSTTLAANVGIS